MFFLYPLLYPIDDSRYFFKILILQSIIWIHYQQLQLTEFSAFFLDAAEAWYLHGPNMYGLLVRIVIIQLSDSFAIKLLDLAHYLTHLDTALFSIAVFPQVLTYFVLHPLQNLIEVLQDLQIGKSIIQGIEHSCYFIFVLRILDIFVHYFCTHLNQPLNSFDGLEDGIVDVSMLIRMMVVKLVYFGGLQIVIDVEVYPVEIVKVKLLCRVFTF